jgi:hypothetical protein
MPADGPVDTTSTYEEYATVVKLPKPLHIEETA